MLQIYNSVREFSTHMSVNIISEYEILEYGPTDFIGIRTIINVQQWFKFELFLPIFWYSTRTAVKVKSKRSMLDI